LQHAAVFWYYRLLHRELGVKGTGTPGGETCQNPEYNAAGHQDSDLQCCHRPMLLTENTQLKLTLKYDYHEQALLICRHLKFNSFSYLVRFTNHVKR